MVERGKPEFIKVEGKSWRVIFFDPMKLEKRLKEFVVNYKVGEVLRLTRECGKL